MIAGAIGGVIVFAITPLVMRFASLSDGAMHYLKYMLLIVDGIILWVLL